MIIEGPSQPKLFYDSTIKCSGDKPSAPFPSCKHPGEDQYCNVP